MQVAQHLEYINSGAVELLVQVAERKPTQHQMELDMDNKVNQKMLDSMPLAFLAADEYVIYSITKA